MPIVNADNLWHFDTNATGEWINSLNSSFNLSYGSTEFLNPSYCKINSCIRILNYSIPPRVVSVYEFYNNQSYSFWVYSEEWNKAGSYSEVLKHFGEVYMEEVGGDHHLVWVLSHYPSAADTIACNYNIELNKWYNIVLTWDEYTQRVYVNGNLECSAAGSNLAVYDSIPISLGLYDGSAYNWKWRIDELQYLNRTMSNTEILDNYNFDNITYNNITCSDIGKNCITLGCYCKSYSGTDWCSYGTKQEWYNANCYYNITTSTLLHAACNMVFQNDGSMFNKTITCRTNGIDTRSCANITDVKGVFATNYYYYNYTNPYDISDPICIFHNISSKVFTFNLTGTHNYGGTLEYPTTNWCADYYYTNFENPFAYETPSLYPQYLNKSGVFATCSLRNDNPNNTIATLFCDLQINCQINQNVTSCNTLCIDGYLHAFGDFDPASGTCVNFTSVELCPNSYCSSPTSCGGEIPVITFPSTPTPSDFAVISGWATSLLFSNTGLALLISTIFATFVGAKLPTDDFKYRTWAFGLVFFAVITIGIWFGYVPAWVIMFPVLILAVIIRKLIVSLFLGK